MVWSHRLSAQRAQIHRSRVRRCRRPLLWREAVSGDYVDCHEYSGLLFNHALIIASLIQSTI